MQTFRNDLCSISIAGVSRKNKWYKIVGLFIRERVDIGLSQSEIEGEGTCPSGKTGCGGRTPQVETSNRFVREKRHCAGVRKGSHLMVEIICNVSCGCLLDLSLYKRGYQDLLKFRLSYLSTLCGCI